MTDKYAGLHCVLVDEKEQAIEVSSDEMNYDIIVPKIEADFFLQDYNRLYPRLNKTDILTDVIGHVVGVQRFGLDELTHHMNYLNISFLFLLLLHKLSIS
ncbi:uncharacterized protein LOC126612445 isoform X8 [Malus sylvestris]|uniref:uncharacterized protein LOC126612445 isoform X8 n=1 Tax=Malus sylvestris TaxID=3752 RepID=UPI0021ABC002|nr:uncharacterized protein LOC126612445 isoform X8 [Malus sylvestris]